MVKRLLKILAALAGIVILGVASVIAFALYGNWHAEQKARVFCDAIPLGSGISTAISRADKDKVLWGRGRFYTFLFPGSFFDKAVCEVEVDQRGMVVKKGSVMVYD
jgi:hypothetical protein